MDTKGGRNAVFIVVGVVIGFVTYYLKSFNQAANQESSDVLAFVILAGISGIVGVSLRSLGTGLCVLIPGIIVYASLAPRIAEAFSR